MGLTFDEVTTPGLLPLARPEPFLLPPILSTIQRPG